MSFLKTKAGPIAIDLGSYAVRALQLTTPGQNPRIVAAACHEYPTRTRGEHPDQDETRDAIRTLLHDHGFTGKEAVTTLNEPDLVVKSLRLPDMPEEELATAIEFEARERIAGLDEESHIRFLPAGPVTGATPSSGSQQEVIVLAASADAVRNRLNLLSDLGLEAAGIDVPPCAVFRPFEQYLRRDEDSEQVNVFVDIGWSHTWITITRGSNIAFAKSFEIAGATFDKSVAQALAIDPAEANRLRRNNNAEPADRDTTEKINAAVRTGLEQLGKEISLCLRYYAVTFRGQRPDTLTCVGGESLNSGHLEHLSAVSGITCRAGFALRSLNGESIFGADPGPQTEWACVAGLALKPIRHGVEVAVI